MVEMVEIAATDAWLERLALLPQPRRVERLAGEHVPGPRGPEPEVAVERGAVGHPEGYRLTILPDRIAIVAEDDAGARHAAMTLRQVARASEPPRASEVALPCLRIEDWPDFQRRGVMLDVSRDRVPSMSTLHALIDLLAEWKLNELQLYVEHTFAYRGHHEVWEHASPLTGEEIQALDAHCRAVGIELVPNQNSFGHMERWLRHPRYLPLAEAPQGFMDPFGKWRDGPFSLCPVDPGSIALMSELYAELLPNFSSRRFNVGCDETFDLCQGRSRAACEARGKGRVYLEYLAAIHAEVERHGRTMMFWGDVIQNHPELIPELPRGMIALQWGYEADHPFAADGEQFVSAEVPVVVCPGTSSWNSIAGRSANALGNLRAAAAAGRKNSAIGYLITDWGDNGHWQPLPVSYLGFAAGAALSWAEAANRDRDFGRALDRHAFHDARGVMGKAAIDLGNVYVASGSPMRNGSVLAHLLLAPEQPITEGAFAGLTLDLLARAEAAIADAAAPLAAAEMARADAELVRDELRHAAALLAFACRFGKARLEAHYEGGDMPAGDRRRLAAELEELVAEYRRLWLERSRPGGLSDSAGRFAAVMKVLGADA